MHRWFVALSFLYVVVVPSVGLANSLSGPGGAPETWPDSFVADIGDLQLRFESRSFWTLYRIDFKGERLCLDKWGSHYGSVAKFPDVGFIGSGHTENEDEVVLGVQLSVDGVNVSVPPDVVSGASLKFEKRARLRTLLLDTVVEVRDNHIVEEVQLQADADTPISLIYHFMHPWTPEMTHFLGELSDGKRVSGVFDDDKAMEIDAPTRWSAVYDAKRGLGAVTVVTDAPEKNWRTRYWDVPGRYRKHYFTTFMNKTVPAGEMFHYRIVTLPFSAAQDAWEEEATRVAGTASP
jgi:hypothetical protein